MCVSALKSQKTEHYMIKVNFRIVAIFVEGEWECNQENLKYTAIIFYFLHMVVV